MKSTMRFGAAAAAVLAFTSAAWAADGLLAHKVKDIDGKEVDLAEAFKGKVVLFVNVASKCGLTPQYKELQALHEKYKDKGLVVAGFPANEFGKQEPGTEAQIKEFCTAKYSVTFPMFAKIVVKGEDTHPLYKGLAAAAGNKAPEWNFAKYLVGKDGKLVGKFGARTKPDDKTIIEAIEKALDAK